MDFLRKLSCLHRRRPSAQEIAQPYRDTLPAPKPVLTPAKVPTRFPANVSHETVSVERESPESSKPTRIASQAPQIPPDLFTNPTVRMVTPDSEGDSPASGQSEIPLRLSREAPMTPSSWLTMGSEELGRRDDDAKQQESRVPDGDLRSLPSVRVTMHGDENEARSHAQ